MPYHLATPLYLLQQRRGPEPKLRPFRLSNMGWVKGLEPSTPGTTIRCSNQLSYTHHTASAQWQRPQPLTQEKPSLPACGPDASPLNGTGTPEGTRTPGPLLRRQLLYPPELQAHMERVMGIEPTRPAWKAGILPLNYTRIVGAFSLCRP